MRRISLKAAREALRDTDIQMTMRYAHLVPSVTRDAVRLPDDASATDHNRSQNQREVSSESGGGAGNRTRVREALNTPSFTCVATVIPGDGARGFGRDLSLTNLGHAIESALAWPSPVV